MSTQVLFGKQLVEIHINKDTGELIERRVNGQKQTPPEAGNQKVVHTQEANITAPAGNFECVYLKIKDNDNNQESEVRLNTHQVPVTGVMKFIQPGQFGEVVLELIRFKKLLCLFLDK